MNTELEKVKKAILDRISGDCDRVLFVADINESFEQFSFIYSLKNSNKYRGVSDAASTLDVLRNYWSGEAKKKPNKMWSGFSYFIDSTHENTDYLYRDLLKETLHDTIETTIEKYFPGMEFELDDDDDNWWD